MSPYLVYPTAFITIALVCNTIWGVLVKSRTRTVSHSEGAEHHPVSDRDVRQPTGSQGKSVVKRHLRTVPNKIDFTRREMESMRAMRASGSSYRTIAAHFDCSHSTVIRKLQEGQK